MLNSGKKTTQLQIRVSPQEKRLIKAAAKLSGKDQSSWVLGLVQSGLGARFQLLMDAIVESNGSTLSWANLHDHLSKLKEQEFILETIAPPPSSMSQLQLNLVSAICEEYALKNKIPAPKWTNKIDPLDTPYFASNLQSLREYLLVASPPIYRRRNLFVDSTLDDRL